MTENNAINNTVAELTKVIVEGSNTVPTEHQSLVCKPKQIESWRIFKIMSEFVDGFNIIRRYGLSISFFGGARASTDDNFYKDAEELAGRLSKKGFSIITGGSSGIMQAANKGAFEAGGTSVGLNINLQNAQKYNPYLTERFTFEHFFVRKVMLTFASDVYIYFPGGFGTLDEFFEIVTLIQTKKILKVPIVLYGKSYWGPLLAFIHKTLYLERYAIDERDMSEFFVLVDSVDEAYDYITTNVSC